MNPRRNAPCPCGSGRKYKDCCLWKDRQALRRRLAGAETAFSLVADGAETARVARRWEAVAAPLPGRIGDDPEARPVLVFVSAGGQVLGTKLLANLSGDPEVVAQELADALRQLARAAGSWPLEIRVGRHDIAVALDRQLADQEEIAYIGSPLLEAEEARRQLWEQLDFDPDLPLVSSTFTWSGWLLPAELVARLFHSAADCYRAAPWRWIDNQHVLLARIPDGGQWWLNVLGSGGEEYGLAIFEDLRDLMAVAIVSPHVDFDFAGAMLSLTYASRNELPREMKAEIRTAGWEVAGPHAYPALFTINTPAGGISTTHVNDLQVLMETLPRFAEANEEMLTSEEQVPLPFSWTDRESGTEIMFYGYLSPRISQEWGYPDQLAPCLAEGPNADPTDVFSTAHEDVDALEEEREQIANDFAEWLRSTGVSEATVSRHVSNANWFVAFLLGAQGVRLPAVSEYDLRLFLYHWYPRLRAVSRTQALAVRTSLRRFLEYLATQRGISCPWASEILAAKYAYEHRLHYCPSPFSPGSEEALWITVLLEDLERRALLPYPVLGDSEDMFWGDGEGPIEQALVTQLHRQWLIWRDELIRSGLTDPDEVMEALIARQQSWEQTAQAELGGQSPCEAVRAERVQARAGGNGHGWG